MFAENDFLKVTFSVREKGGRLAETTDEAEARKENLYSAQAKYGPTLIMLNDSVLVKGIRACLLKAEVGKASTAEISSDEAFGPRRDDLVRLIPLQKFRERDVEPQPGMWVTVDDYTGRVQSVSGGRVRVDLNHELAGKDILYAFKVEQKLSSPREKLEALLLHYLDEPLPVALTEASAEVTAKAETLRKESYLTGKYRVVQNALLYIPEITKLVWKEEFVKETP